MKSLTKRQASLHPDLENLETAEDECHAVNGDQSSHMLANILIAI
jgi:hypothetical protein